MIQLSVIPTLTTTVIIMDQNDHKNIKQKNFLDLEGGPKKPL